MSPFSNKLRQVTASRASAHEHDMSSIWIQGRCRAGEDVAGLIGLISLYILYKGCK